MKIGLHEPTFGEPEIEAAVKVLRSTYVTSGEKVREFEQAFSPNAVMCNSGSSANLLAVAALCNPVVNKLQRGDEVIVSALSWATTVWPLVQHGLVPVIVDIDPQTLNIDLEQAEWAIGPKTKAIMPVHVYGNPCDMDRLMQFEDLLIIEDCCESLGAEWDGTPVGQFGDIGTFSFYFSHHITTLEGGMCVARDSEIYDLLKILRAHGWVRDLDDASSYTDQHPDIDPRFLFVNAGYNLRATELQAVIGLKQLPKLAEFVAIRRLAAKKLTYIFNQYDDVLRVQRELPKARSSWFGFPVTVKDGAEFSAKEIRLYLKRCDIETRSLICGNIARQPGMKLWPHRIAGTLDNADKIMRDGFSLPCHQGMSAYFCEYIGTQLKDFI